jgi:phosphatidylglycerol:prolipoprotein diacylglycerol transferase
MHPELFTIPIPPHPTVKSYGLMMVIGFLTAVTIIRILSRRFTPDPQYITNAALYSLIAGVVGARVFFVIHYFDQFRDDPLSVFAIWNGGLELLGGVLLAIAVIGFYIWYHKLPMRHYLDVLAIGLVAALVFGRIGCFLNGCCYGRPTDLPWGVRFPYGSFAYRSQIHPAPERNRAEPHLDLPDDYFGYVDDQGEFVPDLKPKSRLSPQQREAVTHGRYRCLPVHPTQLYTSGSAAAIALILYAFWRRSQRAEKAGTHRPLTKPGSTFSLMFVLYGLMRFGIEFLRDDNPYEIDSLTIGQLLSLGLIVLGGVLLAVFQRLRPEMLPAPKAEPTAPERPNRPKTRRSKG